MKRRIFSTTLVSFICLYVLAQPYSNFQVIPINSFSEISYGIVKHKQQYFKFSESSLRPFTFNNGFGSPINIAGKVIVTSCFSDNYLYCTVIENELFKIYRLDIEKNKIYELNVKPKVPFKFIDPAKNNHVEETRLSLTSYNEYIIITYQNIRLFEQNKFTSYQDYYILFDNENETHFIETKLVSNLTTSAITYTGVTGNMAFANKNALVFLYNKDGFEKVGYTSFNEALKEYENIKTYSLKPESLKLGNLKKHRNKIYFTLDFYEEISKKINKRALFLFNPPQIKKLEEFEDIAEINDTKFIGDAYYYCTTNKMYKYSLDNDVKELITELPQDMSFSPISWDVQDENTSSYFQKVSAGIVIKTVENKGASNELEEYALLKQESDGNYTKIALRNYFSGSLLKPDFSKNGDGFFYEYKGITYYVTRSKNDFSFYKLNFKEKIIEKIIPNSDNPKEKFIQFKNVHIIGNVMAFEAEYQEKSKTILKTIAYDME